MKERILFLTALLAVLGASLLAGCVEGTECSDASECPTACSGKGSSPQNCIDGNCVVMEIYSQCLKECGASCSSDADCPANQSCYLEGCECVGETTGEPRLSFSAEPCDMGIDPYSTESGINKTTWLDDTTLEVNAIAILNCAEGVEGGDYALSGTNLTLYYEYTSCNDVGLCALCMCAHEMTYTFGNLQKKDYSIVLEERRNITPCEMDEDCDPCEGPFTDSSECIGGKCIVTSRWGVPECSVDCGAECEFDSDCPPGYRCDRYYPEGTCRCVEREVYRWNEGDVSLSTDKIAYNPGEMVELTLKNEMDENICYYSYGGSNCNKTPFNVSWYFGDSWQTLTTLQAGVLCSGDTEPFHCIEVPAGGQETLSWSQSFHGHMENQLFKPAPTGQYQIAVQYRVGEQSWETVESNEFHLVYDV